MTATAGYSIEIITNDNIQKVLRMDDWKKKNEMRVKQWMLGESTEEEENPRENKGIDLSFRRY